MVTLYFVFEFQIACHFYLIFLFGNCHGLRNSIKESCALLCSDCFASIPTTLRSILFLVECMHSEYIFLFSVMQGLLQPIYPKIMMHTWQRETKLCENLRCKLIIAIFFVTFILYNCIPHYSVLSHAISMHFQFSRIGEAAFNPLPKAMNRYSSTNSRFTVRYANLQRMLITFW